ncbi:intraflagellar transport protein 52 homolog [Limulus polyphemus]|uniref:Intraflagellar transport protein 52 homolog n=1 Tax=Limulus polyphemus TaxID=6850 RepID=A0ABM1B3S8_LIMPO|nr:intraflagellar transport protein 52 homolog [Limulus polyphemus]
MGPAVDAVLPVSANREKSNTIIFNASKNELFKLNDGLKTMQRRLKNNWKVISNKEDISQDSLSQATVFVLPGPREKFTESEFNYMRKYLESGGSIFVMLGEGGEKRFQTNINFFLEEYGIMVNHDSVVRTVYYKYFHPKEALVSNGVLNRSISQAAGKVIPGHGVEETNNTQALSFLYPYGATLNVAKPAVAVLSSGSVAFPLNRPLCALYTHLSSGGKLAVLGSVHMMSDQYIDKEENSKIRDVIFQFLTSDEIKLNSIDSDDPEIFDYYMIPSIGKLAEQPFSCLQESEEIPSDYTKLFDNKLFSMDNTILPTVIRSYEQLNMKHEPLRLISPQFETPLPPLQPAVFPSSFRELPKPALELFDLDEAFSSEKARLAQLTNKCTDADLEYYIRECGDILNISNKLPLGGRTAKHILEYILSQVAEFKKLNQEEDMVPPMMDDNPNIVNFS